MSLQHKVFILKVAIAFILISMGIMKLVEPAQWVEWVPGWFTNIITVNKDHIIFVMGTLELFLGLWLLIPWYAHITSIIASIYLIFVVFFEGINKDGALALGIAIATIALTQLLWPKKMDLIYQDH